MAEAGPAQTSFDNRPPVSAVLGRSSGFKGLREGLARFDADIFRSTEIGS